MTNKKAENTLNTSRLKERLLYVKETTDTNFDGTDLQPFVDAKDEITVEVCVHPNKKWVVQSINLQYWYCPDCKKEVKDCPPPTKQ